MFRVKRHGLSWVAVEMLGAEGWRRVCGSEERGGSSFPGRALCSLTEHCQEASSFGCVFSTLEYLQKLGASLEVENVGDNKT